MHQLLQIKETVDSSDGFIDGVCVCVCVYVDKFLQLCANRKSRTIKFKEEYILWYTAIPH